MFDDGFERTGTGMRWVGAPAAALWLVALT